VGRNEWSPTVRHYQFPFNSLPHPWKTIGTKSTFSPNFSSSSFYIAIIGSSGYIGSRLLQYLQGEKNWTVIGYDRIFPGQASHEIPTKDLHKFPVVIYLGGLTGRVACRDRPTDVERENIGDIFNLAKRMIPSQLLIFASTSAIAEGSGSNLFEEDSPVQPHLFDSYVASLLRRENALRNLSLTFKRVPQMVGLRFGTVVGLSSSQRIDLGHMALVCHAFISGKLNVTHPEANRALLCMEDLIRAVMTLIKQSKKAQRFDIFHLQSFSASISNIANTIAWRSGAHIHTWDHSMKDDSRGFSLSTKKFTTTFDFVFQGNQDDIISRLIDDVPRMCLGRQSRLEQNSTRCVVCRSRIMHTVLDLHSQPLANDFRTANSTTCERFPLRLVRCPKCYHTQLSHIVDRKYLFSHYLYQSGTSQSLKTYFAWLAEKVIDESGRRNGTVL
jgi:nucleoside-diphosphate-sugar epimerase